MLRVLPVLLVFIFLFIYFFPVSVQGATSSTSTAEFITTGSMNEPRLGHTSTLLSDGKVLVVGGDSSGNTQPYLNSVELYNPNTGIFSYTGDMTTGRSGHTTTLLSDGKVLITGGMDRWATDHTLISAEIYDPATGVFTPTGNMNAKRTWHQATLLDDGRVLVAGGFDGTYLSSSEIYDPATDTFTLTGNMNDPRIWYAMTLLRDGRVLVAGGSDSYGGWLGSSELYDPATGIFSYSGSLSTPRWIHEGTLLGNDTVLFAGGNGHGPSGEVRLNSVELYDIPTGTFSTTASMNTARAGASQTLLLGGNVLVAGGYNGTITVNTAEIYNHSTSTFAYTTNTITTPRYAHKATRLQNGNVLLTGGTDASNTILASAEIYSQPSTLPQCSDGIDNDGDGFIDYPSDLGCESVNDNTEIDTTIPTYMFVSANTAYYGLNLFNNVNPGLHFFASGPVVDYGPLIGVILKLYAGQYPDTSNQLFTNFAGSKTVSGIHDWWKNIYLHDDIIGNLASATGQYWVSFTPVLPLTTTQIGDAWYANFYNDGSTFVVGEYNPSSPIILDVPYYHQGSTEWCMPTSMAMVFKYYGKNTHSWDIAKEWDWERDVQWWNVLEPTYDMIEQLFNKYGLTTEKISDATDFNVIKTSIDSGKPVILYLRSLTHAVVVVGYNEDVISGARKVYIHDPSSVLGNEFDGYDTNIAGGLDWDEIASRIKFSDYAIVISGEPNSPKGTLDIGMSNDLGLFFYESSETRNINSFAYGKDIGIGWLSNKQLHPLSLTREDYVDYKNYITNHTNIVRDYILEIELVDSITGIASKVSQKITANNGTQRQVQSNPVKISDLIEGRDGDYNIILNLYGVLNNIKTELYDQIVFPSLEYKDWIDTDNDCISDTEEEIIGTNPNDVDTDGDGLWDGWEYNNLDMEDNCNPLGIDLVALGAGPRHKDIFLEIDWMEDENHSHKPYDYSVQRVVDIFSNAPIENIDKNNGINLHVDLSNSVIHEDKTSFDFPGLGFLNSDFDRIKNDNFDEKRKKIFRYVLFAHNLSTLGGFTSDKSGYAELPGNDLIVTLGSFEDEVGTKDDQTGTLMHELGHTLGLKHGGDDSKNSKPNYLSVMNHLFQLRGISKTNSLDTIFDFSRTSLSQLNESSLNEFVGIGSEHMMTYLSCKNKMLFLVAGNGPINWNCKSGIQDVGVTADINSDYLLTRLNGHDDWGSELVYRFQGLSNYANGVRGNLPPVEEELDYKTVKTLSLDRVPQEIKDDSVSPISNIWLDGKKIYDGVYIYSLMLNIEAIDNNGGTGVEIIEHSIDGGMTWLEYIEPLTFTEEGEYTIWYRSTDWFGNVEEAKSVSFEIVSAQGLLEETANWITTQNDKKLKNVEQMLKNALNEKFWQDRNILTEAGGQRVLSHLNNAIRFLSDSVYDKIRARLELALQILNR